MIGILHHCLVTKTKYDEHTAFPTADLNSSAAAA
jgi:hypothetical protein